MGVITSFSLTHSDVNLVIMAWDRNMKYSAPNTSVMMDFPCISSLYIFFNSLVVRFPTLTSNGELMFLIKMQLFYSLLG